MRPITITKQLDAADDNGIATAQQLGAAGDLTLDGALVSGGVADLGTPRRVGITVAVADLSAVNFTVYGTTSQGFEISETIAGPNNNTVSTTRDFATVTRVAADAAVGTDVIVGTTGVGATEWMPLDIYASNGRTTIDTIVTGTVNYTVQYTNDDPFDNSIIQTSKDHPTAALVGATADQYGSTDTIIMRAVRLLINSGTGSVKMTVVQQSLR